jgi:hypothetical protein
MRTRNGAMKTLKMKVKEKFCMFELVYLLIKNLKKCIAADYWKRLILKPSIIFAAIFHALK